MAERENRRDDRGQRGGDRRDRAEETPEFADRLVAINRVSKTVKGGKRFGFAEVHRQCAKLNDGCIKVSINPAVRWFVYRIADQRFNRGV